MDDLVPDDRLERVVRISADTRREDHDVALAQGLRDDPRGNGARMRVRLGQKRNARLARRVESRVREGIRQPREIHRTNTRGRRLEYPRRFDEQCDLSRDGWPAHGEREQDEQAGANDDPRDAARVRHDRLSLTGTRRHPPSGYVSRSGCASGDSSMRDVASSSVATAATSSRVARGRPGHAWMPTP